MANDSRNGDMVQTFHGFSLSFFLDMKSATWKLQKEPNKPNNRTSQLAPAGNG